MLNGLDSWDHGVRQPLCRCGGTVPWKPASFPAFTDLTGRESSRQGDEVEKQNDRGHTDGVGTRGKDISLRLKDSGKAAQGNGA